MNKYHSPDDENRSSTILPMGAVYGLVALMFVIMFGLLVIAAVCKVLW